MDHGDALRADFARYYGIDLDELGASLSVSRAADLAAWLPSDAMTRVADDPMAAWTLIDVLLSCIEHDLRAWVWAHSEDGRERRNFPVALHERAREALEEDDGADDAVKMEVDQVMDFASSLVAKPENQ